MRVIPAMVDMAMKPDDQGIVPDATQPQYPWGLCIRLTQDEMEKLNLEDDVSVGDMLHFHALARVTSVSQSASGDSKTSCIELQITMMSAEDEDEENVTPASERRARLYGE